MRTNPLTYAYVGPRSENNLVSRTQSINQIARSLLERAHLVAERREQLRQPFKLLQLAHGIVFTLRPSDSHSRTEWTAKEIERRFWAAQSDDYAQEGTIEPVFFERCLAILSRQRPAELRLDLDSVDCIYSSPKELDAMGVLVTAGALSVSEGSVITSSGQTLKLGDFSSGQWHILSSLLFAATAVDDDSLILVDEPENSLHPAWQQQFLPLLQSSISCVRGVHVVVATHSPLVAASLNAEDSEILRLHGTRGQLRSNHLRAGPFGWTADEILEEVFGLRSARSVSFTNQMDRALALMAKGDRTNARLREIVESLSKTLPSLPDDDVAKEIIETMVQVVRGSAKNG